MTVKPVTLGDVVDPPENWRSPEASAHAWNFEILRRWDGKKAVVRFSDVKDALSHLARTYLRDSELTEGVIDRYERAGWKVTKGYYQINGWCWERVDYFMFTKAD